MVTDDLDVYETTKIKPLGSELRHVANATSALLTGMIRTIGNIEDLKPESVVNFLREAKGLAFDKSQHPATDISCHLQVTVWLLETNSR